MLQRFSSVEMKRPESWWMQELCSWSRDVLTVHRRKVAGFSLSVAGDSFTSKLIQQIQMSTMVAREQFYNISVCLRST